MTRRILTAALLLSLFVPAAWAQSGQITGTVTDGQSEETIPGVNVAIQELQQGAVTDSEGVYLIENIPPGTYTLRASFVGYDAFETEVTVEPDQRITQNIELSPGAVGLDEVVVTGYGEEQTAAELTGSVSNVSEEEIEGVPVQSTEQLLQGRTAGVQVSATSGNPGAGFSIDVRGDGSINAGSRPLYVVDGVQMSFDANSYLTDRTPLNAINPGDIESIQVLKDAAAAAIYGAQAANGVVLIETKSGQAGPTEVSLNFEGGVRYQKDRWDLMNTDEWLDFQIEAFGEDVTRSGIIAPYGYDPNVDFSELRNFDWSEWLWEPGPHVKTGFTANGGDENTTFYLSGNWSNTGGALTAGAVDYEQYSIRANLGQQFTSSLNVDVNLNLSNQKSKGVCQDGFFINCPFYQAIGEEAPISFPYLENGEYNPNTEQAAIFNPAITLNEEQRNLNVTQFIGNISPSYQLTPWLSAEGSFGLDWQINKQTDYGTPTVDPSRGGNLFRNQNWVTNLTFNGTLNANRTFASVHDVSGVLGTEWRRRTEDDNGFGVSGFNNSLLKVANAASEATGVPGGFNDEFRQLSYFGRANYNYDERYLITLTGRVDGSSRFGDEKRWGFFPSGSFGWRISEESFFGVDAIGELKLRVSYGITGNSQIGDYAARGLYSISDSYSGRTGIRPSQLANQQLTWEERRSTNIGLDWSVWNSRFTGSMNLYREISDNLLLNRPLPSSSGFGSITENVGKVQNQGFELEFETINIQTEDFLWSTSLNVSVRQNEVKELVGDQEALNPGGFTPTRIGRSLQAFNTFRWAGVNPADGRPMYYDADGNLIYEPEATEDEMFFDGGEEDVLGGFGTRVSYKGFSVRAFFDYSYGKTVLQNTLSSYSIAFGENVWGELTNRWQEPGDVAKWPRSEPFGSFPNARDPSATSTYWLFRVNYLRLKNLSVSYSIPSSLAEQVSLQGARIYVRGLNLADWQSVPGIEPEAAGTSEQGDYPTEQQINVGIELDL